MFYLLLEHANKPEEVAHLLEATGLKSTVWVIPPLEIDGSEEEVSRRGVDGFSF